MDDVQQTPSDVPANGFSDVTALQQEIDRLTAELTKFKDLAARAQADVQNARARMEREASDMRQYAAADLLKKLLPTVDNVQRALAHMPQDLQANEWARGIAAIEQEMLKVLAENGLTRMSSVGQSVDPARHEVLMAGPGPADTVTEVFEEGYELHGRVLRPAKVKAGDGSESHPPHSGLRASNG